jgi:predicted metallopeptidase
MVLEEYLGQSQIASRYGRESLSSWMVRLWSLNGILGNTCNSRARACCRSWGQPVAVEEAILVLNSLEQD